MQVQSLCLTQSCEHVPLTQLLPCVPCCHVCRWLWVVVKSHSCKYLETCNDQFCPVTLSLCKICMKKLSLAIPTEQTCTLIPVSIARVNPPWHHPLVCWLLFFEALTLTLWLSPSSLEPKVTIFGWEERIHVAKPLSCMDLTENLRKSIVYFTLNRTLKGQLCSKKVIFESHFQLVKYWSTNPSYNLKEEVFDVFGVRLKNQLS